MIEFIGDFPDETDGSSRKLLDKIIQGAGGRQDLCKYNSIAKRQSIFGKNEESFKNDFYKTVEYPIFTKTGKLSKKTRKAAEQTEELKAFVEQLKQELYETKPNLVVAMGEIPFNILCGLNGIFNYRGSVIESTLIPGLKVLPIVNVRWILEKAKWEYYYITINDLKKGFYESGFPDIRRKQFQSIIAPSLDQCLVFLDDLAQNNKRWSFDIETRWGYVVCVGFAVDNVAFCIPIHTTQGTYFNVKEEALIWQKIGEVFKNNPNLIGQNLSYDLDYMLNYGIEAKNVLLDTMIGQFILAPEMPKGLDYICSLYTDAVYYKDETKQWTSVPDETLWKYNCLSPNTRILTTNLEYVSLYKLAGQWIKTGKTDDIIGIDEFPDNTGKRKLRRSKITKAWQTTKDCYKLSFSDGRIITASSEHPWLCKQNQYQWKETKDLKIGELIAQLGMPWNEDKTYEGGWLAGLYDGEGCITKYNVEFSQKPGLVLDYALNILDNKGLGGYTLHNNKTARYVHSKLPEALRILGSFRPKRLLANAEKLWEGKYPFQGHKPAELINIEYLGQQTVIGISTSTNTFIAEGLITHNCKDTFYTLQASYEIERLLKKNNFWYLWQDYGRKLIPMALEIQKRGLLINKTKQESAQDIIINEYKELRPKVVEAVGFDINVNSPKVVQDYLVKGLGLPLKRKRNTGALTADEDALMGFLTKELPKKYQNKIQSNYKDILTLIMKERHLRKAGTYAGIKIKSGGAFTPDLLFNDVDGNVRCSVNIPGTKTWRFSMSESPHGTGWNIQTAPKKLRFYDAPEGRIFLQPDQKQAEARVVAWKANCKKQIDLFNDPSRSIHLEFGKTVFKHELSKDTPEYTAAKSGVHGGNFRMMAEKLAKTTGIKVEICEKAINGYHNTYPEIRLNYHNALKEEVLEQGYLENPFGLRRYFYHAIGGAKIMGKLSDDDWNDICSWIPQSTIPFITNLTFLKVCDILPYVWLHQQGHDAVLISIPEGFEKETSDCWMEQGRIPCSIKGKELIIPWEMTMGYSWDHMYENYGEFKREMWETRIQKENASSTIYGLSSGEVINSIYGVL